MRPVQLVTGRPDVSLESPVHRDFGSSVCWPQPFVGLCAGDTLDMKPSHQDWSPSSVICFSSVADAQTWLGRVSTSRTKILQFLYLQISSIELLLFTDFVHSSQDKFNSAHFLPLVVLVVLFWTPSGCFDCALAQRNKMQCWHSGAANGCTDLTYKGASRLLTDSSADYGGQTQHGKWHIILSQQGTGEHNQHRFPNAVMHNKTF